MKIINTLLVCLLCLVIFSCKNDKEKLSLEHVKYNNNQTTYSNIKLDSSQVIKKITRQKVQEILDLSTLYSASNKDTEIDSAMYDQIMGYFYKPDSTALNNLLSELDSFKVRRAKLNNFSLYERYFEKDTLSFAKFSVEYFDENNNSTGKKNHVAQYVLIPAEIRLKNEFKFYFLNFYKNPLNDSISTGVTK